MGLADFALGFWATIGYAVAQLAMALLVIALVVGGVFVHMIWRDLKRKAAPKADP